MFRILLTIFLNVGLIFFSNIVLANTAPHHKSNNSGASYYHFPSSRPATGSRVFIFDPNHHAWAAYDAQGRLVKEGRASGGQSYCPDIHRSCRTVSGRFRVISKGGPGCISRKYPIKTHGGAKTPYCMLFHPKGYAIHGYHDVPNKNVSHGCIRVTTAAAQWLNQNFMQIGTPVIVLPYGKR